MSWIEGTKYKKDLENFNETFLSLKGPLEDKEARITLIKFLRQNLYFTTYLLSGVKLAPYQEITYNEYRKWLKKTTDKVDWSKITEYETEDNTENTKELACSAGTCEII